MAKTITITPKAKGTVKAGLLTGTAKVATTPTIDTALCNHLRTAYAGTYYANEETSEGDAVSTLADEYLMKIVKDQQALQPATPITIANVTAGQDANGVIHPVLVAMKAAETAGEVAEKTSVDVAASDIRSSAAAAAMAMGASAEFTGILTDAVKAERTRKQAPGRLAWTLDALFVKRDDKGNVLCNLIDGTGPDFPDTKYPWPQIGTKEKNADGTIVNNPDLQQKSVGGGTKLGWVSWYTEAVRMLPQGKAAWDLRQEYLAAAAKTPTGRFADQSSPDYLDSIAAEKKAGECKNDIDGMVKAIKRAVTLLRHMTAVNEMQHKDQPPRVVARFDVDKKWDTVKKDWVTDTSKLALTDNPIILKDTVSEERLPFSVGEFLSMDPVTGGAAGGTLTDLRKAVGKKKRTPGSGTGATPNAAASTAPVILNMEATANHFAALATTAETKAAWTNYQIYLSKDDHDDALLSTYHLGLAIVHMLQTKPDFRARIARLDKTTELTIADSLGMDVDRQNANGTMKKTG